MKIKVCGLRETENIRQLQQLPIDYMGFIFHKPSPRDVSKQQELKKLLQTENWNSGIAKVGVVVNAEIDEVLNLVHDYKLDYIQLHGEESMEYMQSLNRIWDIGTMHSARLIKAFSIGDDFYYEKVQPYEQFCDLFIFDTKGENPGGNGTVFDWSLLKKYQGMKPFLLSGGIDLEAAVAIRHLNFPQLMGVDINSRFETKPALKDVDKVSDFITRLNPQ